ncbi:MAG TPA: hypothetical protein VE010_00440 [Thermoanaerobaculia bacterium]|nr:hypothetical protein [Thermoanaerobaculia bacterium]
MNIRAVIALSLLLSTGAFAQSTDPMRNVSGTTAVPGPTPWVASTAGGWTFFHGFDAHLTYTSQTGPEEQENDIISTNWLGAGVQRNLGDRAFILARGRVSFEPYTIDEDGYRQFFQHVTDQAGNTLSIDRMRAHDLFGEAGVQLGWRPSDATLVSVYGALVGQPALGAAPAQLRTSGVDFAEAPFAYDIQETFQDSTSVVTAGFSTSWIALEASAFHDAMTTGDHTEIDTGDIDSQSFRVTLMPSQNFHVQVSRGELGEDVAQRTITSASASYGARNAGVTALWTRREYESGRVAETAYGIEVMLRGARNTFLARAEHVDRPAGFPFITQPIGVETDAATHFTAGYLFDVMATGNYRLGVGVNIDYRTQTHHLEDVYGHKPQGIFAFLRFRTGA